MKFVSKCRDLRLIRRPADRIMDEQRRPIILRGERAEFANHQYYTNDPDMIEWLLNHPLYGLEFTSAEPVPDRAVPRPITAEEAQMRYNAVPQMVRGAKATANVIPTKAGREESKTEAAPESSSIITVDDVSKMIDEKLGSAMEQILQAVRGTPKVEDTSPKVETPSPAVNGSSSKKAFHCPICHLPFRSGIEVGKHKKEAHK